MKIFSIFIFAFVLFNLPEQHGTKYLLVEVEGEGPPIVEVPRYKIGPLEVTDLSPFGGTGFRAKENKCAKWKGKGTVAKQCRKPKHKNQPCCRNLQHGRNLQPLLDDVDVQTDGSGEGSDIQCQEKPKNVQKCKEKMAKWTRKNKVEKECNKKIAKYERKPGKNKKMKKCVCTCLKWKQRRDKGSNEPDNGSKEPEKDPLYDPEDDLWPLMADMVPPKIVY